MKKILICIVLFATLLYANEQENKQHRLENMQILAKAMDDIQNGFLYNNKEMIQQGAQAILETSSSIATKDLKSALPEETAYAHKFAQKMANRTQAHAQGILDALQANDPLTAMDEYLYVLRQCTSCHLRIRTW